MSHKALVALGTYSFEVYLFQEPLFRFLERFEPSLRSSAEGFFFFMMALWLTAGLFREYVRDPLVSRIRSGTWPQYSLLLFAQGHRSPAFEGISTLVDWR
uniref:Uncharacterized protein n=1 Tax=Pyrodinium bahamense TaxID=73915 RepID=A0A7S0FMA6_9DINO